MKFQKTINLWKEGVQDKIRTGEIKIQRGQWCVCGANSKRCRFVSVNANGIFNVVHWQGTPAATQSMFMSRVSSQKLTAVYEKEGARAYRKMLTKSQHDDLKRARISNPNQNQI